MEIANSISGTTKTDPRFRVSLVVLLGALVTMGPFSVDMYLPSLPDISRSLGTGISTVELSITSFFLGLLLGQILYGPVSDRFGRKPPLYFGLVAYIIASIACAVAPSIHFLIALRFVQALGACAGIVLARAMVRDLFDGQESARVYSLLMLLLGVSPIFAPLVGGYVATYLGWRAIFWLLAAISSATLLCVSRLLPETRRPNPEVSLRRTFATYGAIARERKFLSFALSGAFAQAGIYVYLTESAFVFINLFGVQAQHVGWFFGVNGLGLILVAQINARLLGHWRFEQILRAGLFVMAAVGVYLLVVGAVGLHLWPVAVGLFCYMSLVGITNPDSTAGALAGQEMHIGSATALLGSVQYTVAALSSTAASYLHNGTSLPMNGLMGVCGILALLTFLLLV